jgi:hypothetical protein
MKSLQADDAPRRGSQRAGDREMKKTALMRWIDDELATEPRLAQAVDDLLAEMKLEQQIVALRETRGLTRNS